MDLKEVVNLIYDILVFIWHAIIYISESIILSVIPRRFRSKVIRGEVALVTGGAGGIGSSIAMKLAMLGAHVIIWDINKSGTCIVCSIRIFELYALLIIWIL